MKITVPLGQLNVKTTTAAPMATTASAATTAPAPMTITPSNSCECDHIVSNDSCVFHQIPTVIGHQLLTHRSNKNELYMCKTLASKLDEIKVIKGNYGVGLIAKTET